MIEIGNTTNLESLRKDAICGRIADQAYNLLRDLDKNRRIENKTYKDFFDILDLVDDSWTKEEILKKINNIKSYFRMYTKRRLKNENLDSLINDLGSIRAYFYNRYLNQEPYISPSLRKN